MTELYAQTHMYREVRAIPDIVRRLLTDGAGNTKSAAEKLKAVNPEVGHDHRSRFLGPCRRLSEIRDRIDMRCSGFIDWSVGQLRLRSQFEAQGRGNHSDQPIGPEPGHRRCGQIGESQRLARHLAYQHRRLSARSGQRDQYRYLRWTGTQRRRHEDVRVLDRSRPAAAGALARGSRLIERAGAFAGRTCDGAFLRLGAACR